MIISHKHRFIFIAIPKTASHSIRKALQPFLGAEDWEQEELFSEKRLPIPSISTMGHGHIPATRIRPHLEQEIWSTYFKFAFVRNPWDRFVSACLMWQKDDDNFQSDPEAFMQKVLVNKKAMKHFLFYPQHHFICDKAAHSLVDFTGKYETLQSDFNTITTQIGLPDITLEKINASVRQPYRDYFTGDWKEIIGKIYQQDIEQFGYRF